jgi:hypothetical protein
MAKFAKTAMVLAGLLAGSPVFAAPSAILVDSVKTFPESMTSTRGRTVIVGSIGAVGAGRIFRALPGAPTAEPWIAVGANHMLAPFGVLADEASHTLWVCSNDAPGGSYHPVAGQAGSALLAFDLGSGKPKGYYPFPEGAQKSLCNDIAIGPDGSAYITDTRNDRMFRLKKGATGLTLWLQRDDLKGGFDGVAFDGSDTLYLGLISASKIMKISLNADGTAGDISELTTDRPIKGPDGIRPAGRHRYIVGEGGRLDLMTVESGHASLVTLAEGMMSAVGGSVSGATAYYIDGRTQYRLNAKMRDQDPGPFTVKTVILPR